MGSCTRPRLGARSSQFNRYDDYFGMILKLFIGGQWIEPAGKVATQSVMNPSRGEPLAEVPLCGADEVERAVQAAHEAFPAWRDTPATQRAQVFFKYKELLERNFDEIARLLSREHGKTREEAGGSLRRGIEVVDLACGVPELLKGETLANTGGGVDYTTHRCPLGVCVGITPFNFPAMIPLWMFPLAIACGNTFVLKPSERTPQTAMRLVELLHESGLPAGVMNLVHGAREAVKALLDHPDIQAVSFVGSTPVAEAVYIQATAQGKRVQAAGGAKNHMVILPDAPPEESIRALIASAFGCAGERCMAGSVLHTTEDAAKKFLSPLREAAGALKIGATDQDGKVDLGPLISREHLERVVGRIAEAEKEGAVVLHDGRQVKVREAPNGYYLGPTILDQVQPKSSAAQEEIFGPVLSIIRTANLDQAIEEINRSPYGNAAVLFTSSGKAAREFERRVNVGMIGINVGVPAPMASFSFSGWNRSFFGDLHVQGTEGIAFYTRQKTCLTRW